MYEIAVAMRSSVQSSGSACDFCMNCGQEWLRAQGKEDLRERLLKGSPLTEYGDLEDAARILNLTIVIHHQRFMEDPEIVGDGLHVVTLLQTQKGDSPEHYDLVLQDPPHQVLPFATQSISPCIFLHICLKLLVKVCNHT